MQIIRLKCSMRISWCVSCIAFVGAMEEPVSTMQNTKIAVMQIGINYTKSKINPLSGCGFDLDNAFHQFWKTPLTKGVLNAQNSVFYTLTDYEDYSGKKGVIQQNCAQSIQNFANKTEHDPKDWMASRIVCMDTQSIAKIPNQAQLVWGAPTRNNIEEAIQHMMSRDDLTHFVLQYSGHGSYQSVLAGSKKVDIFETDGRDEVMVPWDGDTSGMITDNWLHEQIVDQMLNQSKLKSGLALVDACHSESIFDLQCRVDLLGIAKTGSMCRHMRPSRYASKTAPNFLCISGCRDDQTSADAWIQNASQGALTWAFLGTAATLKTRKDWMPSCILTGIDKELKNYFEAAYSDAQFQKPQIMTEFCMETMCYDQRLKKSLAKNPLDPSSELAKQREERFSQIFYPIFGPRQSIESTV
jgi:hypothetical protein